MSDFDDKLNEQAEDEGIITLTDNDGNEVDFEILMTFEYGQDFYVAMLPAEPETEEDAEEVLIMRLVEEEEEDVFYPIEDEAELDAVWQEFQNIYFSEEDEDDDECGCGCGCHHHDD